MSRSGVEIRRARVADLDAILPAIRAADLAECEALFGPGTLPTVARGSLIRSTDAWAAEAGGEPIALFGVAPVIGMAVRIGVPWLFGAAAIQSHGRELMAEGRRYLQFMRAPFDRLENVVDARNAASLRWLRRLGFTILPAMPMGPQGLPFHPFHLEN